MSTPSPDCPTNAAVRPLLLQWCGDNPELVACFNPDQHADLFNRDTTRFQRAAVRQAALTSPCPDRRALLFHLDGKDPLR